MAGEASHAPRRALLITLGFPPAVGGIQRFLYERCLLTPDTIAVLAPRVPGWRTFDASQPFSIRRWPAWGWQIPGLRRVLQTLWPSVLALMWQRRERFNHIECGQALPFGLVVWLLSHLWRVPYDVWTYGDDICKPARRSLVRPLLKVVLARARRVWAISQATRAVVLNLGIIDDKTRVLYPWPDESITPHPTLSQEGKGGGGEGKTVSAPLLLVVARLEKRKGVQEAIHALSLVQREIPEARLVIVGDGSFRGELVRLCDALGLGGSVQFAGRVGDTTLADYYRAASLFIFAPTPDRQRGEMEGFGLVCVEAGAWGCPVVAWSSTGDGVAEAVLDGETGLVVPRGDLTALADAILRLLRDPMLSARLGENGRRRAAHLVQEARWAMAASLDDAPARAERRR